MADVDQMTAPDLETPEKKKKAKSSKKKGGLKLNLIVIVISQLILAGGGYYMVSKFIKPDPMFDQAMEQTAESEEHGDAAGEGEGHGEKQIHLLEDIIVNPAGTRGSRYLSVSIGVEMNAAGAEEGGGGHGGPAAEISPLDNKKPQLRDALIGILSAKTIIQLTTIEEKEAIRQEILAAFQTVLEPEPVHQIYFVDFVLQ
ncbi:MAG: flagellar basal body-associated FliL family protein [candidate division Zixibacteria bacterium]|nr:flagellar basal body-associated FliL family protein [candidate division Zixibacteria bacterium]